MTLAALLRARSLESHIAAREAEHLAITDRDAIAARQLARLNESWPRSLVASPYARALREEFRLPTSFASWAHFDAAVPPVDKQTLRPLIEQVRGEAKPGAFTWRSTGGSTGEPFRFPVSSDELIVASANIWLGRRWKGISPDDKLFLIWGHAHQLGQGWRGRVNRVKREVSDRLMGYVRHSAYDLAPHQLDNALERLIRQKPTYVIGYSSALDRFARHNRDHALDLAKLGLKAVIATAEPFPHDDSEEMVSATFGTEVIMEYGATESGPLAHQRVQRGPYQIFWTDHRLSSRAGAGSDSPNELRAGEAEITQSEILITSLYPRALPLLRYTVGDAAITGAASMPTITRLKRILGAANETVALPDGRDVHFEAFSHCLHDASGVDAFQIVRRPGDWPLLRYEGRGPMHAEEEAEVRRRLAIVSPGLDKIKFVRAPRLKQSIAGKHRVIVDV